MMQHKRYMLQMQNSPLAVAVTTEPGATLEPRLTVEGSRPGYEPDVTMLRRLLGEWVQEAQPAARHHNVDRAVQHCLSVFSTWPVGSGAGEFLAEPHFDGTQPAERGICQSWLSAAWWRMKQSARSE